MSVWSLQTIVTQTLFVQTTKDLSLVNVNRGTQEEGRRELVKVSTILSTESCHLSLLQGAMGICATGNWDFMPTRKRSSFLVVSLMIGFKCRQNLQLAKQAFHALFFQNATVWTNNEN